MHDVQMQAMQADLMRMRGRLDQLELEVQQFRRMRDVRLEGERQIRWCVTSNPTSGEYPEAAANVFPIKFVDAHFSASVGLQALSKTNRSNAATQFAFASTGQFVPRDVPLPCFWLPGLGGEDAGIWWLLDPPQRHYGKLSGSLERNGTALMVVWVLDVAGEWQATTASITVRDWFLRFQEEGTVLEAGTGLAVMWHLASGANAKYVVDDASCLPTDFFAVEEEEE